MRSGQKRIIGGAIALTTAIIGGLALFGTSTAPGGPEAGRASRAGMWQLLSSLDEPLSEGDGEAIGDDPLVRRFTVERAPLIRDVFVEKSVICVGEEVLVRVTGANPGGKDSHLMYRIAGRAGDRAVLSFKRPGTKEFTVVAGDEGMKIDFRKVTLEVTECRAKPSLSLSSRPGPTNPDEIEFQAHREPGTRPTVYRWDFGDGSRVETNVPRVVHSYFGREQRCFASSFLVSVTAAEGEARTVVTLANIHYIAGEMGNSLVPVMADRIARWSDDRLVTALTVKNIHAAAITFSGAAITVYGADGGEREVTVGSLPSLLSMQAIPGGALQTGSLVIPRGMLPADASALRVRLQGSLAGGEDVTAILHVTIPPDPARGPAPGDAAVSDQTMIGKLERARAILGPGRPITAEDIRTLEGDGRL